MLHGEQLLKVAEQKKIDETPRVVLCNAIMVITKNIYIVS